MSRKAELTDVDRYWINHCCFGCMVDDLDYKVVSDWDLAPSMEEARQIVAEAFGFKDGSEFRYSVDIDAPTLHPFVLTVENLLKNPNGFFLFKIMQARNAHDQGSDTGGPAVTGQNCP